MNVLVWVGVAVLGGIGAIARFVVDGTIGSRVSTNFPLGTFAINISGALILGLLAGLAVGGNALVLVGTATLGSYTTFSTWMLESQRLTEDGELPLALLNILVSLAVGVGAAALGHAIGAHA
ncbi:MAG TPA: fluoride efflux transporter CrcB [Solirubrobacteraceae bacterium]